MITINSEMNEAVINGRVYRQQAPAEPEIEDQASSIDHMESLEVERRQQPVHATIEVKTGGDPLLLMPANDHHLLQVPHDT